jgi:hypothetical protein
MSYDVGNGIMSYDVGNGIMSYDVGTIKDLTVLFNKTWSLPLGNGHLIEFHLTEPVDRKFVII